MNVRERDTITVGQRNASGCVLGEVSGQRDLLLCTTTFESNGFPTDWKPGYVVAEARTPKVVGNGELGVGDIMWRPHSSSMENGQINGWRYTFPIVPSLN